MSSKRDKLLEEAQKWTVRGQITKAIKLYEQIITLDPTAVNHRQKHAELLVKAARLDDARREYEAIGRDYSLNGFYLKAIAVFKRMQVLFPVDMALTLKLAELYQKQGLLANAMAEYRHAYDYYSQLSNESQLLKILDLMQQADQKNAGIKLKFAEALYTAGWKSQSYASFLTLGCLLADKGDVAAMNKLHARLKKIFPEKTGIVYELFTAAISESNPAGAAACLQPFLKARPYDRLLWDLLADAYGKLQLPQRLKAICQHYYHRFPEDTAAQKKMLECLVSEKEVTSALAFLARHEKQLAEGCSAGWLTAIYDELDRAEPGNRRILEGLERACRASGQLVKAAASAIAIAALEKGADPQHKNPKSEDTDTGPCREKMMRDGDTSLNQKEIVIEIEVDLEGLEYADTIPGSDLSWGKEREGSPDHCDASLPRIRSVKFENDLDVTDSRSHYDLGVAFKEMALYDEAINEFIQASCAPERTFQCLLLQAACLCSKGDAGGAERLLCSLSKQELSLRERYLLKQELAAICSMNAETAQAAALLAEIDAFAPGMPAPGIHSGKVEHVSLDISEEEFCLLRLG